MSGSAPSDPESDDWFDEPRPRSSRAPGSSAEGASADDWIGGSETAPARRRPVDARSLATRPVVIAGAAGALVLLLIGLAVSGVFSEEAGNTPAPTPTTTATTASTPTQPTATPAPIGPPATTLKPGAKGAEVKTLQRALASLGYSPGPVDGQYGPGTQKAVASFQKASRLTADGVLGPKTLAALAKALGKTG